MVNWTMVIMEKLIKIICCLLLLKMSQMLCSFQLQC